MTEPPECTACRREYRDDCPVCGGIIPGTVAAQLNELGAALREFEQRLTESTSPALVRAAKVVGRWAVAVERRRGR